jgi:hypothetical protein
MFDVALAGVSNASRYTRSVLHKKYRPTIRQKTRLDHNPSKSRVRVVRIFGGIAVPGEYAPWVPK